MDSDLPKLSDTIASRASRQDLTVSPALEAFIKFLARIAVEKHLAAMQQTASSARIASPQCGGEERLAPHFTHSNEEKKND
jgi:hypothetical protein